MVTWTLITSAAAGQQVALATTALPFSETHGFQTSHTYAAVPFPAGRPLAFLDINGGAQPATVTINGQAATVVGYAGMRTLVLGPTALAAGNYAVGVTTGDPDKAFNAATIRTAALTNANASPVVGFAKLPYLYRGDDDHAVDAAITIPTSGLGVMIYLNEPNAFTLTAGYILARDMGDGWNWVTTSGSGTYHIKSNDYGNTFMLAAGFSA